VRRYPTRGDKDISVSDAGEFGLIARIRARVRSQASVLLGPGDDAAVVTSPDGRVVVTTDTLVEGVHFRRDWSSAFQVGRKAAAQSLADVVAMGAYPTAIVVGLAAPADLSLEWADGVVDGLQAECASMSAGLAGGDVVRSSTLTLSVTALGDLRGRDPVTRAGAMAGDVVVVAGRLGFAAAGLDLLRAGRREPATLVDAHRAPPVAYEAGLRLAIAGATSMIDVSDGLVADLGHIADESGVRIELAADDLPLPSELVDAALSLGVDPRSWVAAGGEDHAFAATMPDSAALRAVAMLADLAEPVPIVQVGRVVAGPPGVVFVDEAPPMVRGHDHFA
jgi:thiamine-monophosphate kinase